MPQALALRSGLRARPQRLARAPSMAEHSAFLVVREDAVTALHSPMRSRWSSHQPPAAIGVSALSGGGLGRQVAAHAEHHICVRKAAGADGRALTRFEALAADARAEEVAAMLGLGRAEALQLLAAAQG